MTDAERRQKLPSLPSLPRHRRQRRGGGRRLCCKGAADAASAAVTTVDAASPPVVQRHLPPCSWRNGGRRRQRRRHHRPCRLTAAIAEAVAAVFVAKRRPTPLAPPSPPSPPPYRPNCRGRSRHVHGRAAADVSCAAVASASSPSVQRPWLPCPRQSDGGRRGRRRRRRRYLGRCHRVRGRLSGVRAALKVAGALTAAAITDTVAAVSAEEQRGTPRAPPSPLPHRRQCRGGGHGVRHTLAVGVAGAAVTAVTRQQLETSGPFRSKVSF